MKLKWPLIVPKKNDLEDTIMTLKKLQASEDYHIQPTENTNLKEVINDMANHLHDLIHENDLEDVMKVKLQIR